MRCSNCGAEIMNGAQFCTNCGAQQVQQQTYQQFGANPQQPYGGTPNQAYGVNMQQQYANGYQQATPYANNQYDMANNAASLEDAALWLKIVCLLIPIVGIVIYFVKKNNEPVAAKSCLTFALIGVALNVFSSYLIF